MAHSVLTFLLISTTLLCGVASENPISFYSPLRYIRQIQSCTTEQVDALRQNLTNASSCPNDITGFPISHVFLGKVSQEFVQSFCEPQCNYPVVAYYNNCISGTGPGIAQLFIQLCSTNAHGEKCYASAVIQAINAAMLPCTAIVEGSSCDTACREAARSALEVAECCVHLVDVPGTNFVGNISAACGISAPDTCSASGDSPTTTSNGTSSTTTGITSASTPTTISSASTMVGGTILSNALTTVPLIMTAMAAVLVSLFMELS